MIGSSPPVFSEPQRQGKGPVKQDGPFFPQKTRRPEGESQTLPQRKRRPKRAGSLLLSLGFFFGNPGPGVSQLCLGLPQDPNTAGIEGALETQNGGHRIGGSVHVNVAGRLGLLGGVSGGAFDDFAETGSAFRGLLALPLTPTPSRVCLFGEYERETEPFREAFEMTRGSYSERWARFGLAAAGDLWEGGGVTLAWHAAPEIIFRRTRVKGRTTYWEPEIHVLETTREHSASHLGGRALVSARMERVRMALSVKSRPRQASDLHWAVHLGIPF